MVAPPRRGRRCQPARSARPLPRPSRPGLAASPSPAARLPASRCATADRRASRPGFHPPRSSSRGESASQSRSRQAELEEAVSAYLELVHAFEHAIRIDARPRARSSRPHAGGTSSQRCAARAHRGAGAAARSRRCLRMSRIGAASVAVRGRYVGRPRAGYGASRLTAPPSPSAWLRSFRSPRRIARRSSIESLRCPRSISPWCTRQDPSLAARGASLPHIARCTCAASGYPAPSSSFGMTTRSRPASSAPSPKRDRRSSSSRAGARSRRRRRSRGAGSGTFRTSSWWRVTTRGRGRDGGAS